MDERDHAPLSDDDPLVQKALEEIEREEGVDRRPAWQRTKENWYDHLNLSVKQLDIIIACGIGGLILVGILIALDACGVI